MKTAVASPDEGPDKKKYGIPPKDKKGLSKKTEYEYKSDRYKKTPSSNRYKEGDPQKKYNNASQYGEEMHNVRKQEPKNKDKHELPRERKNPKNREEDKKGRIGQDVKKLKIESKPKEKLPTDDAARAARRAARKKAYLQYAAKYKVVENKIKKPEDKEKEKSNKLRRTASRSKTSIRMKKKAK